MFKVVCLKFQRTIFTTDDPVLAEKRRKFHFQSSNHKTRVYEVIAEKKVTGKDLLQDDSAGNLIISDEEE